MNINEIASVTSEVVLFSHTHPVFDISRYNFFANPSNSPVENTFSASDELRQTLTCQRLARIASSASALCDLICDLKGLGSGSAGRPSPVLGKYGLCSCPLGRTISMTSEVCPDAHPSLSGVSRWSEPAARAG